MTPVIGPTPEQPDRPGEPDRGAGVAALRARNLLLLLLCAGLVLAGVGGWIIAAGYPHRVDFGDGSYQDEGSATAVITGAFFLGIAQCLLLVSLIGYGVWLGLAARDAGRADQE